MGRLFDPDDLLEVGEVAEILGLAQKNSVTTYMRRYEDFPKPVIDLRSSRVRLWLRQDIQEWRAGRHK